MRHTKVLNPFIRSEQEMNKGLNSLCDSLVVFLFLLAFHRPESHAKFPGKWPYWHLKVCPKLGPCLCWGQRDTRWLSIKKEVNTQMNRRQMLDEVMSQGRPGAPQELCFCELMCHYCSLWWFHAAVGLWGRGGDALLHVKRHLRNNNTKTVFWGSVCKGVELRVTPPSCF